MPKSPPLTPPATPIALQKSHLLSPAPDRLTNTPTTLSITSTENHVLTVHRLLAHEPSETPKGQLLYTVLEKQWPAGMRVICAQNAPVLVLRRAWLSGARKWGVRLPDEGKGKGKGKGEEREKVELLNASMPWIGEGNLKIGVGGGFQLDLEFRNALALTTYRFAGRERTSSIPEPHICDEPPPYSDVAGDVEEERRSTQRNEKDGLFHDSNYGNASPEQSPPDIRTQPDSASILPSYASARLSSSNTLRDLLDAIEPPEDPAPAPELAPTSPFALSSSGSRSRPRSGHETADINTGQRVELKVLQSAASGTGVMMGNHRIMYITRHNAMDYSKSKSKLKARWEVQVAEGVDLLLAVNIVLIMMEVGSSR